MIASGIMNNQTVLEPRTSPERLIINLEQIKSILYLGLKGEVVLVPPAASENHRIDTLA